MMKNIFKKNRAPKNRLLAGLFRGVKIIAAVSILILFLQDFLMFHPGHDEQSWAYLTAQAEFHAVEFLSNGNTRHGLLRHGAQEEGPLIIFFYGNAMNAAGTMRAMERIGIWPYFLDFNLLVVDYAGYGPGRMGVRRRMQPAGMRPSARNLYADALATFDFARTLPGVSQIIVGAYSIGTAPAVYLAAHRETAGLFLLSPFANVYDLFNNVLPIFHGPLRLLVRHKFYSDRYAQAVTVPALLVASRSDEVIPFASSQRLNDRFGG
ncbi:MAG: hypothetical protein FWD91_07695, partial [Treponema sp.]|nr:hypothetical protein [Treponema sp.]